MPDLIIKNCKIDIPNMDKEANDLLAAQRDTLKKVCTYQHITIGELSALEFILAMIKTIEKDGENYRKKDASAGFTKLLGSGITVVFKDMNFTLLKKHKSKLLNMTAADKFEAEDIDVFEGMLNLIDHIQDDAVVRYGLDKNRVFFFPKNIEYAK